MKRLLVIAAAIAAAVTLVACGGGSGGGSNSNASTVSAKQIAGAGSVLVDSKGRALYASDQETHGKVLCTGACNSFWEPLTVSGGLPKNSSVADELGVIKRPDGARQLTYDGKLLYSFTQDRPGKVTGDGFKDAFGSQQFTWHVVHSNDSTGSSGSGKSAGQSSPGY
jgi:predicted lipoprotein with Yx(FWY)xxD motif